MLSRTPPHSLNLQNFLMFYHRLEKRAVSSNESFECCPIQVLRYIFIFLSLSQTENNPCSLEHSWSPVCIYKNLLAYMIFRRWSVTGARYQYGPIYQTQHATHSTRISSAHHRAHLALHKHLHDHHTSAIHGILLAARRGAAGLFEEFWSLRGVRRVCNRSRRNRPQT